MEPPGPPSAAAHAAHGTVAAIWHIESARVVAAAARLTRDLGLAEECAQDALATDPALTRYHLLPSVRGDLLARLDRVGEARAEFERAAKLARNARERALLLARAAACTGAP